MSVYVPCPGDLVTIGAVNLTNWRVMAVCGDVAWVRREGSADDRFKPVSRLHPVDTTDTDAPTGHYLDHFFETPKVA